MQIPGKPYRATISGASAVCRLDGDASRATLYYPRHTKLGRRLLSNAGSARAIVANYIRQEMGWPSGDGVATPISFVGV